MKNITLTRNGQTAPRDVETSTMHADGLVVGQGVMLRIKGDCCPGMKPTPYKEYVVTAIKKTDRFDGKCSDVTFTAATQAKKPAAVVPEVVDASPVPLQPDLPAGGVPMEDAKVAGALREAWRIAKRIETHAVAAALKFGAMLAVAEGVVGDGRGRGKKGEGFKGWLAKHCPEIHYVTAVRWKKLAVAAAAMMGLEVPRFQLSLDAKWWRRNGGDMKPAVAKKRAVLLGAESVRALAALVFDYRSENRREGREEGSKNVEKTDAQRAREDWGLWISDLSDAWALKSIPLLGAGEARTAYNSLKPLVAALKRRMEEAD